LFFNEELCKKDVFSKQLTVDEQTTIKQVFMIGNNILRWVIDNIREETKCFHDLLSLYDICVSIENEKIKLSKFITANISNEHYVYTTEQSIEYWFKQNYLVLALKSASKHCQQYYQLGRYVGTSLSSEGKNGNVCDIQTSKNTYLKSQIALNTLNVKTNR